LRRQQAAECIQHIALPELRFMLADVSRRQQAVGVGRRLRRRRERLTLTDSYRAPVSRLRLSGRVFRRFRPGGRAPEWCFPAQNPRGQVSCIEQYNRSARICLRILAAKDACRRHLKRNMLYIKQGAGSGRRKTRRIPVVIVYMSDD
jgi:hypothetical protein